MKRTLLNIICVLWASLLWAQMHNGRFGNEWIDYNQSYYKMQVWNDGVYRIPRQTLVNAGINLSSISPDNFQLFCMGNEVPIYVHAPSGNIDYIEFYGKKNKGDLDINLYNNPAWHFNPEYSLISDTAAYFLTWNNNTTNNRFTNRSANLSLGLPREDYYWQTSSVVYTNLYQYGKPCNVAGEELHKSIYDYGEGYGTDVANSLTASVPISNIYTGGASARCEVRMYAQGVSGQPHTPTMFVNGTQVYATTFYGDSVLSLQTTLPIARINSPNSSVQIRGMASPADLLSVSYVKMEYPRTFNFGGSAHFPFKITSNGQPRYLEINNVDITNANQQQMYLYDLTNQQRINCFWSSPRVMVDLQASSSAYELVFVNAGNPNAVTTIGRLDAVQFDNIAATPTANYIIVYHPHLTSDSLGTNPVLEYAAYRSSSFDVVAYNIQQLYDQFAYGVNNHPLAVRNLAHFAKNRWNNPKYMFLIGKGRTPRDIRAVTPYDMLIPTMGYPPSDNILVASAQSDVPTIPVGRLAATNGNQVRLYLEKTRQMEQNRNLPQTYANRHWTKNILHLGGGRDNNEQGIIRNYLNNAKGIIENPRFGASIESFFKTSTSPIQSAQSAYLTSLIDSGVTAITFFGHSSANSFDFNLDNPASYANYQRFPLVLALGCYGGTIFESTYNISEQFIFAKHNVTTQPVGASVFLASVGAAELGALGQFLQLYYTTASTAYYGEGTGKILQQTIYTMENSGLYDDRMQMAAQYLCHHGDPAFNFNVAKRPDYYIDNDLVTHTPTAVSIQDNTFDLTLDIQNFGEAIDTSFVVEITRQYPDGTLAIVARQRVQAPYSNRVVSVPITVGGNNALGINYFKIEIEAGDAIDEQPQPSAEQNNIVLQYAVHITSDAILPVYPAEFAIVPTQPVALKASTGNTLASSETYVIQMDTTEYFNSSWLRQTRITQAGGLLEWTPSIPYVDSVVYYWRVSIDSTSPSAGYQWATSSFMYLTGSYPGWNQSHFFQFKKDKFRNLTLQEGARKFDYITSLQELVVHNGFTPSPLNNELLAVYLNGSRVDKCNCPIQKGVFVQVYDPLTMEPWKIGQGVATRAGATNCDAGLRQTTLFLFKTNEPNATSSQIAQQNLITFLRDSVPNGHYVTFFTLNDAGASNWIPTVYTHLLSEGATQSYLDSLQASARPYAFIYRKGNPTFQYRKDSVGANATSIIRISGGVPGSWDEGDLTSTIIGPATDWAHLYWQSDNLDNLSGNVSTVNVYGLDTSGQANLLIANLNLSHDTTLAWINAAQYPYLQMVWHSKDSLNQTSENLHYWRVLADLVPEAALRPELYFSIVQDTIERGSPLELELAMQNISAANMDSMLVKFQVLGSNVLMYQRLKPLLAGDTMRVRASIPTIDLSGAQQLLVEINPNNDQLERYHFNNVALIPFYVNRDKINPVMDVTFDGVHILDGDIVSGKPEIAIQLSDENKYLALDDASDFNIVLRHPSFPNGEMALDATTTDLEFYPADVSNLAAQNKARLLLRPDLVNDGIYTMYVSAKDKSDNNAGNLSYSIDFKVINNSSISNVLNYPNPFTTSTQFVFTLTGRELPDYVKIQIFTVNGKIVREIGMEELGTLRIGLNRTEFAWDGTDTYGDRLANGVYLYRVIAKKNGQDYDAYNNNRVDYMFKDGFGKMYLMR